VTGLTSLNVRFSHFSRNVALTSFIIYEHVVHLSDVGCRTFVHFDGIVSGRA
jgi:hypothetical protein